MISAPNGSITDHATPNLRNFQRALAKPVEFEIHKYRIIELQFSASRPAEPSDYYPIGALTGPPSKDE
jgi:hypothetical protein